MHTLAELAGADLPLLVALKALLETESVSETARRLGSTQPAMSRTLARLRELFDDPLLVSVGRRMMKTARARELQPRLDGALDGLRQLFSPPPTLLPKDEERVVRIAASDYATAIVLHPWMRRLRAEAPKVTVDISAIGAASIDPLARGDLDLALAPRLAVVGMDQFVYRKVLDDRLVCVLRAGHPLAGKRLTLRGYLSLEHVMVGNVLPTVSAVQLALHALRKTRTVVARVPSFLSAIRLVAESDLAAAVPERLVRGSSAAVTLHPLPFPVEPIALNLMWHPRHTTDPFHRWMRDGIAADVRDLSARR